MTVPSACVQSDLDNGKAERRAGSLISDRDAVADLLDRCISIASCGVGMICGLGHVRYRNVTGEAAIIGSFYVLDVQ